MTLHRRTFLGVTAAGAAGVGLSLLGVGPAHASTGVPATAPTTPFAVGVRRYDWTRGSRPCTTYVYYPATGTAGGNASALVTTSSGDAVVTPADAWVEYGTPLSGTTMVGGPQATVLGSPAPFSGAMTFAGNWLADTFSTPLSYTGHEQNFQAYVHTLTIADPQNIVAIVSSKSASVCDSSGPTMIVPAWLTTMSIRPKWRRVASIN